MVYEEEQKLIELLAVIYSKVPWGKMRTSKNPHDIFNHRVRAAARREGIYAFASKLCNYFGLQSLPEEVIPILEYLRGNETEVLNRLSSEHIPYCVRAIVLAKSRKSEKQKEINMLNFNEVSND
ncbi:MAG: hypothetical protein N2517_09295 [Ignavibacteria bacterium]|nr:hypothetical protein [Ignavibacteria bacterium]